MREIFKLRLVEFILYLMIAIITIIWNPSIQLLRIPFLIIIIIRSITIKLEDAILGGNKWNIK